MNESVDSLPLSYLPRGIGDRIAYLRHAGSQGNGVIFLSGFNSTLRGNKATELHRWAVDNDRPFVRFDYFGHGTSSGRFEDGTITRWRDDALAVLDQLSTGPQILVGSSMGAWIALLATLARPERVAGLVLLAPAPDFTETLIWQGMSIEARACILRDGVWMRPSAYGSAPYPISKSLIEDGRQHLLLGGEITVRCGVRILHGMADPDVPWTHGLSLFSRLVSKDACLHLIPGGDHRLSDPENLDRMIRLVEELSR